MSEWLPAESPDPITRRRWLLRLGETVMLAGVSGLVPEAIAEQITTAKEMNHAPATALPAGLYLPSADHLAHALEYARKEYIISSGSQTEYAQPSTAPYQPQFFSPEELPVVTRLIEIALGGMEPVALSQTVHWVDCWLKSSVGVREAAQQLDPLHRALAAAYHGETVVAELETSNPQLVVRQGVPALHDVSITRYGSPFLEVSEAKQTELLTWVRATQTDHPLRKFFELIRDQAIRGYYTSRPGLKELDYQGNAYHGQCPGCS